MPAKPLENCRDAPLLGSTDTGRFNLQSRSRDLSHRCPRDRLEVGSDHLFPGIGLEASILFRRDILPLEIAVRPPKRSGSIFVKSLSEELIAIGREAVGIDGRDLHGPKSAPTRFIPKIGGLVRGADEDDLPRLDYFLASVARPITLGCASYKSLQCRGIGFAHRRHLTYFDEPLSGEMLIDVLPARHLGKVVGEPLAAKD